MPLSQNLLWGLMLHIANLEEIVEWLHHQELGFRHSGQWKGAFGPHALTGVEAS